MRDYGKVYGTFWISDTTRQLSDEAKVLALYLLTGPHTNMIGCFRLPDGYVEEDLNWSSATVTKRFVELFRNGFATRDEGSKWVYLPAFLKWNPLENPNQGKAAARLFEQIPKSASFKSAIANALAAQNGKVPETVLEPFRNGSETLSEPGTGTGTGTGENLAGSDDPEADLDPKPKPTRQRDLLFDAIVDVTGSDPHTAASHVAKVKKLLAGADPPYTPDEVRAFGRRFGELCTWAKDKGRARRPTVGEVEKYIGQIRAVPVDDEDAEHAARMEREAARVKREAEERKAIGNTRDDEAPF